MTDSISSSNDRPQTPNSPTKRKLIEKCAEQIEYYAAQVQALEQAAQFPTADQILQVLAAKHEAEDLCKRLPSSAFNELFEAITAIFTHRQPRSARQRFQRKLDRLEAQLGQKADRIRQAMTLEAWQSLPVHKREWLELLTAHEAESWNDRFGWILQGCSLIVVLFALCWLAALISRAISSISEGGLIATAVVPGLLTVLLGQGILTESGHRVLQQILRSLRIPPSWQNVATLLLAIALLSLVWGLWLMLPTFSDWAMQEGNVAYNKGYIQKAATKLEQATKLYPANSTAHFYLGQVYEDLQREDEATIQYEIAVRDSMLSAEQVADAYNRMIKIALQNSALSLDSNNGESQVGLHRDIAIALQQNSQGQAQKRLMDCRERLEGEKYKCGLELVTEAYLKVDKYKEVASLLTELQEFPFGQYQPPDRQYTLLVAMGTAYAKQTKAAFLDGAGRAFQEAILLERAVLLEKVTPIPYCTLAQIEDQKHPSQTSRLERMKLWEQCLGKIRRKTIEEIEWNGIALQRLKQLGSQP